MQVSFAARLAIATGVASIVAALWVTDYLLRARGRRLITWPGIKLLLQNAALATVSLSISFVFAEAAYRIYLYQVVQSQLVQMVKGNLSRGLLYQFDPQIGFHYKPNSSYVNTGPFKNEFRIDQFGFVANDLDPSLYTMEKPQGEYRITVLGGSFTLGVAVYVRWTDLLQDYLNRSPAWRARVGGKFTRVINFGLDGTGPVQWAKVYQFRASEFAPDLVIVDLVTATLLEHFIYRGTTDVSAEDNSAIQKFVQRKLLSGLPWYGFYSELAAAVGSVFTRTDRRLTAAAAYLNFTTFGDRVTSIRNDMAALQQVRCLNPNTIIVHQPIIEEVQVRKDTQERYPAETSNPPAWVGLETAFLTAAEQDNLQVVPILDRNPSPSDHARIYALYNGPIDTHASDYGVAVYAQEVFRYLVDWGTSHRDPPVGASACSETR